MQRNQTNTSDNGVPLAGARGRPSYSRCTLGVNQVHGARSVSARLLTVTFMYPSHVTTQNGQLTIPHSSRLSNRRNNLRNSLLSSRLSNRLNSRHNNPHSSQHSSPASNPPNSHRNSLRSNPRRSQPSSRLNNQQLHLQSFARH